MLGLFGIFGRSERLQALDQALRVFDVHPRTVPEALKLATIKLLQRASGASSKLSDADYSNAAELLGYAILGPDQFVASNSLADANRAELRLEAAIEAGDDQDANLILLAMNAGVLHPTIADRFEVETSD